LTSPASKQFYAHDESPHPVTFNPKLIAVPESTQDVVSIVNWCRENNYSVIAYGTGSALEGGVIPQNENTCTIDLSKMNNIVSVNEGDQTCVVEAGVTREDLNSYIRETGLHFPVDPGANASLGGMAATSASGTTAVRYGTMKENIVNLEVVLANGEVIHTAGKDRHFKKSSAGYNLTELFVGSEGTLGIITKVTLRLHPQPEAVHAAVCQFDSAEAAVHTTIEALQYNIPLARVELLDVMSIKVCNDYANTDLEEKPTLFFEFQGTESNVAADADLVKEIAEGYECVSWSDASSMEERSRLWKARHALWFAFSSQFGKSEQKPYATDVCVPIDKLDEMISRAAEILDNSYAKGQYGMLGHVGDGNFHIILPVNELLREELKAVSTQITTVALDLNGTCTGEHGIGLGKKAALKRELGLGTIETMQAIKSALDPTNLLNPGKVL